jgi:hypothetical protein
VAQATAAGPVLVIDGFHPRLNVPGARLVTPPGPRRLLSWSLITHGGERRPVVQRLRQAAADVAAERQWLVAPRGSWLPLHDPHRGTPRIESRCAGP